MYCLFPADIFKTSFKKQKQFFPSSSSHREKRLLELQRIILRNVHVCALMCACVYFCALQNLRKRVFWDFCFCFFKLFYLFIQFWLSWDIAATKAFLQLQQAGSTVQLWCAGFSLQWLLSLWNMGSRALGLQQLPHMGPIVVASQFSRSAACGIFTTQGSNPCLLHWQTDSLSLIHQGSP